MLVENWSAGGIPANILRQREIEERGKLAEQKNAITGHRTTADLDAIIRFQHPIEQL